jgi:hypothetical protein
MNDGLDGMITSRAFVSEQAAENSFGVRWQAQRDAALDCDAALD